MAFVRAAYAQYVFVLLVLLIGFCLTVTAAFSYQQHYEAKVMSAFEDAATDRIETIRDFMSYSLFIIKSMNAFYQSSSSINYEEFSSFAEPLMENHPYIRSIGWIPYVTQAQRALFEAQGKELLPDYTFTEKDTAGNFKKESIADEYYPILYTYPAHSIEQGLGFDISRDPERNAIMSRAHKTRLPQASGRITFLNTTDSTQREGIIFLAPVYKKHHIKNTSGNNTYERLEGFVSTSISLHTLIETAIRPLQQQGVNIIIRDMSTDTPDKQFLFVRSTRLKDIAEREILEDLKKENTMTRSTQINVGGRNWNISVLQARGYFSTSISGSTYAILGGGILFTLLLAFYMLSSTRENERISIEVADRTEALNRAKRQTDLILLSTHEGIIGIDTLGKITFCNPRAVGLLGYTKRDLIGKNYHDIIRPIEDSKIIPSGICSIGQVLLDGLTCSTARQNFTTKNGNIFPVEFTASPMMEADDVAGAVLIFHDITERRQFEDNLKNMAQYDQMTGLCNRHLFMHTLEGALARADRTQKKTAVIFFDLNGFKKMNDELGHAAGDDMLKAFAQHLKKCLREGDTAARLGGDEFTVLAENMDDGTECLQAIDRLLEDLEKNPVMIAGAAHYLSASVGIAFYPDNASDADSLVRHADNAMYKAKKAKNRKYALYNSSDEAKVG